MNKIEPTQKFLYINIHDYLDTKDETMIGELKDMFSDFSCPKNKDVEEFLKKSAIDFTRKSQSVTYIVFTTDEMEFVGYFTIALKPLIINYDNTNLTNKVRNKLNRISEINETDSSYLMSAFLIAQLGKNYYQDACQKITGTELLSLAIEVISVINRLIGGLIIFLETDPQNKLLNFYTKEDNNFKPFSERNTKGEESHRLIRLMKVL